MKIDRIKVHQKYGGRCAYCGKEITVKEMQVDHILSKKLHQYQVWYNIENPTDKNKVKKERDKNDCFENLNPSCRRCNFYKGSETLEQFRKQIKTIHERIMNPFISKLGQQYGIIEIKEWNGLFYFEIVENKT